VLQTPLLSISVRKVSWTLGFWNEYMDDAFLKQLTPPYEG